MIYSVRYNHTSIVNVSVDIETVDIGAAQELQQEFSVRFVRDGTQHLDTRAQSGNPGYVIGKPTLGGMVPDKNHTASDVIAQEAGFTVMDTGKAGQCSSSSPTGSVR